MTNGPLFLKNGVEHKIQNSFKCRFIHVQRIIIIIVSINNLTNLIIIIHTDPYNRPNTRIKLTEHEYFQGFCRA